MLGENETTRMLRFPSQRLALKYLTESFFLLALIGERFVTSPWMVAFAQGAPISDTSNSS